MSDLSYRSPKTIVKKSPIHGQGLFAREPIGAGEVVAIKGGYIFDTATWRSLERELGIFVALRDIEPGEELTHDWATTDDEAYEITCNCGASSCRGTITGHDWLRPDLQRKYQGHFAWYLQRRIDELRRPQVVAEQSPGEDLA